MPYSKEEKRNILDSIYTKMEQGTSVRCILRKNRIISRTNFNDWIKESDEEVNRYTRALKAMFDEMADQLIEISDDTADDTMINDKGQESYNGEFVQRSRLRIDTRKWILEKCDPKRFGVNPADENKAVDKIIVEYVRAKDESQ